MVVYNMGVAPSKAAVVPAEARPGVEFMSELSAVRVPGTLTDMTSTMLSFDEQSTTATPMTGRSLVVR